MSEDTSLYDQYDRSLERLVLLDEPICEQVRAAFEAGRRMEREATDAR